MDRHEALNPSEMIEIYHHYYLYSLASTSTCV